MFYRTLYYSVLILIIFNTRTDAQHSSKKCSYVTWTWDTKSKKAINHKKTTKSKKLLRKTERDRHSPCTICEEDQEWIHIEGISPFQVCKHFAEQIRSVIQSSLKQGFPIHEVIGYRVGKTKGRVDSSGLRTEYSHHSFGTAIDINPKSNALYDNCITFNSKCRILRGGKWDPNNPSSIKKDSPIYKEFLKIAWQWGGELKGKQKDFMHFSISGD